MKKNLLFYLITLFCITFANAQTEIIPQLSNEEFFTQAEIVFEGYYIATVATYDPSGTGNFEDSYRVVAYKAQRVYKGAQYTAGDTIYVVYRGAVLGEEIYSAKYVEVGGSVGITSLARHGFVCNVNISSPAIHFLTTSDFPDDNNSKYATYKKYKMMKKYSDENRRPEIYDVLFVCGERLIGLDGLLFHQREDFYNYMRQFRGFMVPEISQEPEYGAEMDETILDSVPYENIKVVPSSKPNKIDKYQNKQSKKKVKENPKGRGNYILYRGSLDKD